MVEFVLRFWFSVKAKYYKLALIFHPDRVDDMQKTAAKEKFTIIQQAYSILVNAESRRMYDNGDTNILFRKPTIVGKWEEYVKVISLSDIENARRNYQGSSREEDDIVREIRIGKGSITHLFNNIPFMRYEDEPRIIEIIKRCMEAGKIPKTIIRKICK